MAAARFSFFARLWDNGPVIPGCAEGADPESRRGPE
jgi:hypothetical protein